MKGPGAPRPLNLHFSQCAAQPDLPSPHVDARGHHGGEELLRGSQELRGDAGVQERAVSWPERRDRIGKI